jgi:hypothetical protein
VLKVIKLAPAYSPTKTNLNVFQMTGFITLVDTKIPRVTEKPGEYDNSFEARLGLQT